MITLLIWLLILIIVFGFAIWIIQMLPLPPPFGSIAMAVVGLIFLLILISMLMGGLPFHPIRLP